MNTDHRKSAQPCGCDEGANYRCQWHTELFEALAAKERNISRAVEVTCAKEEALIMGQTDGVPVAVGNGVQTDFGTGATRSSDEGKIDYEGHISPRVIRIFGEYMNEHRVQRDGKIRGSDNWQEGIPVYRYTKSLIRHAQEFHLMWRGEEVVNLDSGKPFTFRTVLCAILFNTMGLLFELSRPANRAALNAPCISKEMRQALEQVKEAK